MNKYLILPIEYPGVGFTPLEFVHAAWRKAQKLQMILQFEIEFCHITFRIYPDMESKEIYNIGINIIEYERLYIEQKK